MSITAEKFKQVMRNWTTGITIITSEYQGYIHGMTVNSFTSISVEPPIVIISLANQTRTCELVKNSHVFGVTILSSAQKEISNSFAGKIAENEDRFAGLKTFFLSSPCPLISGGLAWLDCAIIDEIKMDNSTLFIAKVLAAKIGSGDPLIHHNRNYYRLGEKDG